MAAVSIVQFARGETRQVRENQGERLVLDVKFVSGVFSPTIPPIGSSGCLQARPINGADGIWRHVDGPLYADFPGLDTIDKVWRHIASQFTSADCLGTRQLLHVHMETQGDGRQFEKVGRVCGVERMPGFGGRLRGSPLCIIARNFFEST